MPTTPLAPNLSLPNWSSQAQRTALVIPLILTTNAPGELITIPPLSVSDFLSISIRASGVASIEAFSASFGISEGGALVNLSIDNGAGAMVPLCSSSVHIDTIFGNNFKKYFLPAVLRIDETKAIVAQFTNIDPGPEDNTFRICMHAALNEIPVNDNNATIAKQREMDKGRLSYPYFYTFDNDPAATNPQQGCVTMTGGQQSDYTITLKGGCDFRLTQISGLSTGVYSIDIIDAITGRSIINAIGDTNYPVNSALFVGTGRYPFKFHVAHEFRNGQKLIVRLKNRSGTTNAIFLTLAGENMIDKIDLVAR